MSTLKESQISNTSSPLDWIYSVYQVVGLQKFQPHPPNYDNQSRPFQIKARRFQVSSCETCELLAKLESKNFKSRNVVQNPWSSPHFPWELVKKPWVFFRNSLLVYIQQRSTAIMAFKSQILTWRKWWEGWHLRVAMTCLFPSEGWISRWWQLKYFLFSSQLGEDSHFD